MRPTIRPVPAINRNGMPGWKPYVYRGTGADRLTGWMDGLTPEEREQRDARARLEVAAREMYGRRR